MFRELIRRKYNECCNRESYINFRKELENFGADKFNKELETLSGKFNPLSKIVLSIERGENIGEQYVDFGKYILVRDKFANKHFLLIPKDLSYFNVLTLGKRDLSMLCEMKDLILERFGKNYILFFHCYPYNSVHTLHMHVVQEEFYMGKNNNLILEDVIYVLSNE
jgi:hypothetical protein